MRKKGFFISFEGGEGAGKSTQVDMLVNHLLEDGFKVTVTREPGGTRIGEQIRAITHSQENVDLDSKAESYLMAAARAQHITQIIGPALKSGYIVVCDRFIDSSIAYQGYGRKLGPERIEILNELATNGSRPDLTVLLDVPVETGLKRRKKSGKPSDRLDLQQKAFYERVRVGFLNLAKKESSRYLVIDASKSVQEVATLIWRIVLRLLTKYNVEKTKIKKNKLQ